MDEPNDKGCILGLRTSPGEALLDIHRQAELSDFSGTGHQFRVDDIDAFAIPPDDRFRSRGPVNRPGEAAICSSRIRTG